MSIGTWRVNNYKVSQARSFDKMIILILCNRHIID